MTDRALQQTCQMGIETSGILVHNTHKKGSHHFKPDTLSRMYYSVEVDALEKNENTGDVDFDQRHFRSADTSFITCKYTMSWYTRFKGASSIFMLRRYQIKVGARPKTALPKNLREWKHLLRVRSILVLISQCQHLRLDFFDSTGGIVQAFLLCFQFQPLFRRASTSHDNP